VIWDGETYDDGMDITPEAFYNRLSQSQSMPTISQVTVAEFTRLFTKYHSEGKDILLILISSKMSGTIDSAFQAKAILLAANIEIIDGLSATM